MKVEEYKPKSTDIPQKKFRLFIDELSKSDPPKPIVELNKYDHKFQD